MEKVHVYYITYPYAGCTKYVITGDLVIHKDQSMKSKLVICADDKDDAIKKLEQFNTGNIFKCDMRTLKIGDEYEKEENQQGDTSNPKSRKKNKQGAGD